MNVPQLRFSGFEGEWTQQELSELLEFKNGINADKDSYGHGAKFINVLDILNNDYILSENIIGSVNATEKQLQTYSVTYGDILFLRSSETREDVGVCNVYLDQAKPAVFGGFVIRGKKIADYSPFFLKSVLNNSSARNQISSKAGGSTRYNVGQTILSEVIVQLPHIEEQQKISSFLMLFNQKIEKQQEKIEKLEQFKKGMMQKIFSQELRFKDEDGGEFPEWEEKKLGQVLKIKHGRDQKKIEIADGKFPILATGGVIGRTDTFIYDKESVLIGRKGTIDRPVYMDTPFWTVDTLFYSEIKESNYPKFIFYVFQNINWKLYNEASGVPSLSAKTIEAIKIAAPDFNEQKMIADYISIIDKKIEKEKEKLMVLEEQKKGFMWVMFI